MSSDSHRKWIKEKETHIKDEKAKVLNIKQGGRSATTSRLAGDSTSLQGHGSYPTTGHGSFFTGSQHKNLLAT
jgi:hypothetical protein